MQGPEELIQFWFVEHGYEAPKFHAVDGTGASGEETAAGLSRAPDRRRLRLHD